MNWRELNNTPSEGQAVLVKIRESELWRGGFILATYGGGNYFIDTLFFTITDTLEFVTDISNKIDRSLIEGWIPVSDLV